MSVMYVLAVMLILHVCTALFKEWEIGLFTKKWTLRGLMALQTLLLLIAVTMVTDTVKDFVIVTLILGSIKILEVYLFTEIKDTFKTVNVLVVGVRAFIIVILLGYCIRFIMTYNGIQVIGGIAMITLMEINSKKKDDKEERNIDLRSGFYLLSRIGAMVLGGYMALNLIGQDHFVLEPKPSIMVRKQLEKEYKIQPEDIDYVRYFGKRGIKKDDKPSNLVIEVGDMEYAAYYEKNTITHLRKLPEE